MSEVDQNRVLVKRFFDVIQQNDLSVAEFAELERIIAQYPDVLTCSNPDPEFRKYDIGFTPLHTACWHGSSYKVIELLICHNHDVLQIAGEKLGNLPLHILRKGSTNSDDEHLLILKLMVDTFPSSVEARNKRNRTPLHCACLEKCSYPVIEYLVGLYPQALQVKDTWVFTPLHLACCSGIDVSVVQFLYIEFPLAARWSNIHGIWPIIFAYTRTVEWEDRNSNMPPTEEYANYLDVLTYVAYECWPVFSYFVYTTYIDCFDISAALKIVEDVTKEVVCALIDVASHARAKHTLPVTVVVHIAQIVMRCHNRSGHSKTSSATVLCSDQCRDLVLDESARQNLDWTALLLSIRQNKELLRQLECLLLHDDGHDELQEMLDSVIRMNRAGRLYYMKDPENTQQGVKVLQSTTNVSGLYLHVQENPLLCKRG